MTPPTPKRKGRTRDPRTERIMIRATLEEREEWCRLAYEVGLPLSTWLRQAAQEKRRRQEAE